MSTWLPLRTVTCRRCDWHCLRFAKFEGAKNTRLDNGALPLAKFFGRALQTGSEFEADEVIDGQTIDLEASIVGREVCSRA